MSKLFIALAFLGIIGSLGSALFYLMRDKGQSNKTVKALANRVGLSIALFVCILISHQLGWIEASQHRF
ncbi:MAG: twin transmembrane helix small protein [Burkholderiaceae bacterium]